MRTVAIPRKGRPGKARQAHEHRRAFRRAVKWRTGSEARISTLKRQYGWDRTRLDGLDGARIWTGHGVLAHNLAKIAALRRVIDHRRLINISNADGIRHQASAPSAFRRSK